MTRAVADPSGGAGRRALTRGSDDQIVPIADAVYKSIKLVRNGTMKVYDGSPPGIYGAYHDIYASAGTFKDKSSWATDAAATIKAIECVPDIPMFRRNTAALAHEMAEELASNVGGDGNYVRVQVLTNKSALIGTRTSRLLISWQRSSSLRQTTKASRIEPGCC